MKNDTVRFLLVLCIIFSMYSCNKKDIDAISFTNHPNLKLGFTTQNFIEVAPISEEEAKKFVDYSLENGFSWFELRDPDGVLAYEECLRISEYAREKGIEIAYSNQRSFLDSDFEEVYKKGVKNATAFTGPGTIRALISGKLFADTPGKKRLTAEELDRILAIARDASALAKKNNLSLIVENGSETFFSEEENNMGIVSFLAATDGYVDFQLDTGNPFTGEKSYPSNKQVQEFVKENISRLKYIHLKSAAEGSPLPYLQDSELDYGRIFSTMSENNVQYIAIELAAVTDPVEVLQNHKTSLDYLREKAYIE